MKGKLLIIVSTILAGCSNAPSSGDVEKALEAVVASCKNVKVYDVKKTNGLQEDGFYRVEYKYRVKLNDKSKLHKLKEIWAAAKQRSAEFVVAHDAYEKKREQLEAEIRAVEASVPRPPEPQRPFWTLEGAARDTYNATQDEWRSRVNAATEAKRKELDALQEAWRATSAENSRSAIYENTGPFMMGFYTEGCTLDGSKYLTPAIGAHADLAKQDETLWFEPQEVEVTGAMGMRKTENGWRKI